MIYNTFIIKFVSTTQYYRWWEKETERRAEQFTKHTRTPKRQWNKQETLTWLYQRFLMYNVRSVLIAILRAKNNQTTPFKYKIDNGCGSNVIPINKFKALFPITQIAYLSMYIDKKVVLHEYNNPWIKQVSICNETIIILAMSFNTTSL